jgi:2-dehydro-3-deoxyphosphogluconate aldolase/(4S)-4-hydroxy-2-oxoglutarate aldolase
MDDPVIFQPRRFPIVPIVTIDNAHHARATASALLEGGITCAEITLRTPDALRALEHMASVEGFTVGAGTVLDVADVHRSIDHGARFVVTPGLNRDVVAAARNRDVAIVPGTATPTEILTARSMGLHLVKVFPVATLGGVAYIDALGGPFADMTFMPSGGVGPADIAAYLARPCVAAIGVSWIAAREAIDTGDYAGITTAAASAVAAQSKAPK